MGNKREELKIKLTEFIIQGGIKNDINYVKRKNTQSNSNTS
ncbi:hypothetical protein CLSAP_30220 [Clostridium saccharoperbutylacetonicum]|jgi:hypothetical protein|nr:hypothetical protein CLSAP_30220 [Clostridium saccharoperbutylacetonicum]NSB31569.1 hypothetical protein [Clostridium saccharoperbutylacetonicum]